MLWAFAHHCTENTKCLKTVARKQYVLYIYVCVNIISPKVCSLTVRVGKKTTLMCAVTDVSISIRAKNIIINNISEYLVTAIRGQQCSCSVELHRNAL